MQTYEVTYSVKFKTLLAIPDGQYDSVAEAIGDMIDIPEGVDGQYIKDSFELEGYKPVKLCDECGKEFEKGGTECPSCQDTPIRENEPISLLNLSREYEPKILSLLQMLKEGFERRYGYEMNEPFRLTESFTYAWILPSKFLSLKDFAIEVSIIELGNGSHIGFHLEVIIADTTIIGWYNPYDHCKRNWARLNNPNEIGEAWEALVASCPSSDYVGMVQRYFEGQ